MSVLIKDMEMPKCCNDCSLLYDHMCCIVTTTPLFSYPDNQLVIDDEKERLPDCPLIPMPTPHGNLIDREALMKVYGVYLGDKLIGTLPTVNIDDVINAQIILESEG